MCQNRLWHILLARYCSNSARPSVPTILCAQHCADHDVWLRGLHTLYVEPDGATVTATLHAAELIQLRQ